jgi:hypothetical protein
VLRGRTQVLSKRSFTIYELDDRRSVRATEEFTASDLFEAHDKARKRMRRGASIELWEGSVCLLRMKRGV